MKAELVFIFLSGVQLLLTFAMSKKVHRDGFAKAACKNRMPDVTCEFWKRHQACKRLPKRMYDYCKQSCHFCAGICEDNVYIRCRWLVMHNACYTHKKQMLKMCPRSCEFCVQRSWGSMARSPPECSTTKYGCCMDGHTAAKGPNFKGCSVIRCEDLRPSLCRQFKPDCYHGSRNINFMRENCAGTCNVCNAKARPVFKQS